VLPGVTGESHAFSIAKRMGIEDDILARAESLMGEQVLPRVCCEAGREDAATRRGCVRPRPWSPTQQQRPRP
jgi:hypothetical protein